jgi:hypothetical protein
MAEGQENFTYHRNAHISLRVVEGSGVHLVIHRNGFRLGFILRKTFSNFHAVVGEGFKEGSRGFVKQKKKDECSENLQN